MSTETDSRKGIFDPLIGRNGAKAILRSSIRRGDVNILLSGPPGSGKSVALLSIEDAVEDAEYVEAGGLSERKLRDTLKENPPVLLLDEFDNMDPDAYKALNTALEQGRVTKKVHGDSYDVKVDTQVFAVCNEEVSVPDDIMDRFVHLPLHPYTREEYVEVCSILLPRQVEWVGEAEDPGEVGARIACTVWDETGSRSPRAARDAARLADSVERVPAIVKAMNNPTADVESDPVYAEDISYDSGRTDGEKQDSGPDMPEDPKDALPAAAVRRLEHEAENRGIDLTDEVYEQAWVEWQEQVN
jgi:predicted ATPase with chaperone activity